ncbi:MAG: helix-turn-helix domain-containing protein [Ruminococcus flavefaciens]|nr:helix-turn-helix domain-containing protein [Ruminococcus flavefaciens]
MIGKQLKYLRELKRKSQQEVCSILNIEQSTLANYENDKRVPKIDILIKLAEYYSVSVDCLLGLKKIGSFGNCDNYFYEDGMANWNIRKKSKEKGLSYDEVFGRTCIDKERFDLLWYGNAQPTAEELIRFSEVLDVSIDFLLDNSQREHMTAEEELILLHYKKFPKEVMELLSSFTALSERDRKKVLGKCLDLEDEATIKNNVATPRASFSSSVAADELLPTETDNPKK